MISPSTIRDLEKELKEIEKRKTPDLVDRLELISLLLDPTTMSMKEIQDYIEWCKENDNEKYSLVSVFTKYVCPKPNISNTKSRGVITYIKNLTSLIDAYFQIDDSDTIINPKAKIQDTKNELAKIEGKINEFYENHEALDSQIKELDKKKKELDTKKQAYENDLKKYQELKASTEKLENQITEFEESVKKISIKDMEERNEKLVKDFSEAKENVLKDKSLVDYLLNVKKAVEAYELVNEIEDVISITKACEIDKKTSENIEFACTEENTKPIRAARLKLEEPYNELVKELKVIVEKLTKE